LIRLLTLILTLIPAALRAEVYPALHDVTGVAANDVLNIREAPSAGAPVIGTLAPNAKAVEVVAVADGWALVNTGERSGYAAMRFLTRSDGADWNALESPLTCLGTEPFWSLQIDPVKGKTRYQTPEDPEARVAAIDQKWPGTPWAPAAAVGLPEGLAVLTPADCSDGMSEQSYGIAVDIFLQQGGAARLSGCCQLGLP
jgi:uncharacterized membrane protein